MWESLNLLQVIKNSTCVPRIRHLIELDEEKIQANLAPPKIELKPLPSTLKYVFLTLNKSYPMVISSTLNLS